MGIKVKNTKFLLKRWVREEGVVGPVYAILYIVFKILNSVFTIFLTSKAILILQENNDPLKAFLLIIAMISIYALSCTFENYCYQKLYTGLFLYRILEMPHLFIKLLKLPYEYIEGSMGKKKFEKANEAIGAGNEVGVEEAIRSLVNLIIDICCLLIFMLLCAKLHPLIMIVLILTGSLRVIKDVKNRKWILGHQDEKNSVIYEMYYLYRKCLDNKIGKDVRIYKMQKWFSDKFGFLRGNIMGYITKKETNNFKAQGIGLLAGIFRDGICYGYLVYRVTKGLSISDFVLYLGVISGLNIWIKNIFEHYASFAENIIVVDNLRTFLEGKELGEGEYELTIPKAKNYTYVFENVNFSYEDGSPLFENLNLTIRGGEKIALVGANGAGKTTLVKLMSGLYTPKSGRILINGVDISKVNPKEVLKLTGIVFQDTKVFPESIVKNISCKLEEDSDEALINKSLKGANFHETVQNLALKEKTILTKNLDQSGVELSGGQYQKLMLARALYKNAAVLILDEPTAALDPLAEADMYLRYNEFTSLDHSMGPIVILNALVSGLIPFIPIVFSAPILNELINKQYKAAFQYSIIMAVMICICGIFSEYINKLLNVRSMELAFKIESMLHEKPLMVDYESIEDGKVIKDFNSALMSLRYKGSYSTLLKDYAKLLQNIISFIFALGLTVQLCISVGKSNYKWLNTAVNPVLSIIFILISIIAISGAMGKIVKWAQNKMNESFEVKLDSEKKFAYLGRMVRDDDMVKMIQSYNAENLVEDTFKNTSKVIRKHYKKECRLWNISSVAQAFAGALITVLSYGIVTLKILANAISIGSFLKYSQAIVKMNEAILNIVSANQDISEIMIYMNKLMKFLDLENKFETGSIPIEKRSDHEYKFCFENVWSKAF